jgi:hypothetical protein
LVSFAVELMVEQKEEVLESATVERSVEKLEMNLAKQSDSSENYSVELMEDLMVGKKVEQWDKMKVWMMVDVVVAKRVV